MDKDTVLPLYASYGVCADSIRRQRDTDWERVKPLVEAAKLARKRFSEQNGQVCQEVWNGNYPALHALVEALAQLEVK